MQRKAHPVRAVFSDIGFYAKETGIALMDTLRLSNPYDREDRRYHMPREVMRSRRRFLIGMGALGIVAAVKGATRAIDVVTTGIGDEQRLSDDTLPALEEAVADFSDDELESFAYGEIIPEDERTGKNIMIGINPESKFVSARDLPDSISEVYGSLLESLAEGTTVRIVIPEGIEQDPEDIREEYPHLNISFYEVPFSREGNDFMQDVVFASGSKDEQGRFLIGTSRLDVALTDSVIRKYQYDVRGRAVIDTHLILDEPLRTTTTKGVGAIGDDILAKKYPDIFSKKMVLPPVAGGDLAITRLPNGKLGALVGRHNLMRLFDGLSRNAAGSVSPNYFNNILEDSKRKYAKALGVDEVIIPGQEHMKTYLADYGMIDLKKMLMECLSGDTPKNFPFFHIDMAVKTATTPDGENVAFCTDIESRKNEYPSNAKTYLDDIRSQFGDLGFKIVNLPCGPHAPMNYTNCLMFTNEEGEKIVMLPQYGIDEDKEAENIYRSQGFKVVPVDMTDSMDTSAKTAGREGSLHCRTVVLN